MLTILVALLSVASPLAAAQSVTTFEVDTSVVLFTTHENYLSFTIDMVCRGAFFCHHPQYM
jgi:hypothetical protein